MSALILTTHNKGLVVGSFTTHGDDMASVIILFLHWEKMLLFPIRNDQSKYDSRMFGYVIVNGLAPGDLLYFAWLEGYE